MKTILILIALLACAGCQTSTRKIKLPSGVEYESTVKSFLSNPNYGAVSWKQTGEKTGEFTFGGYSHEQTQVVKDALQKAAAALGSVP